LRLRVLQGRAERADGRAGARAGAGSPGQRRPARVDRDAVAEGRPGRKLPAGAQELVREDCAADSAATRGRGSGDHRAAEDEAGHRPAAHDGRGPRPRDVLRGVAMKNQQILLARRPQGAAVEDDFRMVEAEVPPVREGQLLTRVHYLSLDPYMRGRMDDAKSYAAPQPVGEVMVGGTVAEVVESKNPKLKPGD